MHIINYDVHITEIQWNERVPNTCSHELVHKTHTLIVVVTLKSRPLTLHEPHNIQNEKLFYIMFANRLIS